MGKWQVVFTRIKTKSFKVDGDFQLGARRTINDTVTLSTTAGQVDFFSNSGSASVINFGLNASEINIAGQGGTTTINNQTIDNIVNLETSDT